MSSLLTFEETDLCPGRLDLSPRRNRLRNWLLGVVALLAVLLAGLAFVILNWPFTRVLVEKDLSDATFSTVRIDSFKQTYFPSSRLYRDRCDVSSKSRWQWPAAYKGSETHNPGQSPYVCSQNMSLLFGRMARTLCYRPLPAAKLGYSTFAS